MLIILLIVIGSKVIYKDNFAILTGTIDLVISGENTTGYKDINYPEGFNKDNCVVVACGISGNTNGNTEFAFGDSGDNASSYVTGAMPRMVRLREESINFQIYLGIKASNGTRNYKIVLMKTGD